jgi:hypothetical protein
MLQDPSLAPIRLVEGGDDPQAAQYHSQVKVVTLSTCSAPLIWQVMLMHSLAMSPLQQVPGLKDPYAFKVYALAFLTTFQARLEE